MGVNFSTNEYKDTEIGEIPCNWEVASLKSIVSKTVKRNPTKQPEESFKYIDVSSVSNESYRITEWKSLTGKEAPSRARKVVTAGDTIFATVRPYLKNIAKIPQELDDQICSTGFCVISGNVDQVDSDFLFYSVITDPFVQRVVSKQKGSSYPAVSDSDVLEELISLPSLPEQKSIAYVLSTIQNAVEVQERVISAARELKRSLMRRLFTYGPYEEECPTRETEIGEVPAHWKIVKLTDVVSFTRKPKSLSITENQQIPFVAMELLPEEDVWSEQFELRTFEQIKSGVFFQRGDILVGKITPSFENGKQGIVERIPETFGYATTEVYPIHPSDHKVLDCEYLFFFLKLQNVRNDIAMKMEGSTGRQRVPKAVLENYPFPLPPIDEQKLIAEYITNVHEKIRLAQQYKSALQQLLKSMLHQLMTGRIRVNDMGLNENE